MSNQTVERLDYMRKRAEEDFFYFLQLVNPSYCYGGVHEEVCAWVTRPVKGLNQLVLLPRAHLKSHLAINHCAWTITKNPEMAVIYLSATATLAEAQLYALKNILTSDIYRMLWPDMVNQRESDRERWNAGEIMVDHPARKDAGTRDATVKAGGITMNITGLHADAIYLDDVVVPDNAYTEEGRRKVQAIYSQLASIKNPGCSTLIVGTRYHPRDLYDSLKEVEYNVVDEETGEIIGTDRIYEIFEKVVEQDEVFLWPRQRAENGNFYGFNRTVLEQIYAEYLDKTQFYAQYYNDPNDPESQRISEEKFQYYDRKHLEQSNGSWFYKDRRLNLYAAVDFAFSLARNADYTAIVVIGIDCDHNIYVLDIDRFKTTQIAVYFDRILKLYERWEFKKLRAETVAAQKAIVKELKEAYIARHGLNLSVDENNVTRHEGNKEERIAAILEPRYDNGSMWHYKGGNCQLLEDEVMLARPQHDDIKDALAAAVEIAVAPVLDRRRTKESKIITHPRFGGVR